jgi:hypothetical protein
MMGHRGGRAAAPMPPRRRGFIQRYRLHLVGFVQFAGGMQERFPDVVCLDAAAIGGESAGSRRACFLTMPKNKHRTTI